MSYGQNSDWTEAKRRVEHGQQGLRELSDDELMRIHESILDEPEQRRDPALLAAVLGEIDRRFTAAGSFWHRWRKREEYEKWVRHTDKMKSKAIQEVPVTQGKYEDTSAREAIGLLKAGSDDWQPEGLKNIDDESAQIASYEVAHEVNHVEQISSTDDLPKDAMRCFYHPGNNAVNTCSKCGQAVCSQCNYVTGTHPICRHCWDELFPK